MQTTAVTSTGLTPRTAATLAYLSWWVTGLVFWLVERQDRFVRFHAAQAMVAFGAISVMIAAFLGLAGAALSFLPAARRRSRCSVRNRNRAVADGDVESGEWRRVSPPARRRLGRQDEFVICDLRFVI